MATSDTSSPGRPLGGPRPFLIAVAGGTCSGKTTFTEQLTRRAGEQVVLVKLDAYEVPRWGDPFQQRADANHDHPDAFDWSLLNRHLAELSAGRPVDSPVYDYAMHTRSQEVRPLQPAPIVIVEGILALHDADLRRRFDLKVFVDAPADLRFIRRLERDVVQRGRTPENIVRQYLATVRPSHEEFVEPCKAYADLILPDGRNSESVLDMLLARIREIVDSATGVAAV